MKAGHPSAEIVFNPSDTYHSSSAVTRSGIGCNALLGSNNNGEMSMAEEDRISGECGKCGEAVTLVRNSVDRTCRSDGSRYIYPDREDMQHSGWCIFRCRGCHAVIDENWRPLQTTIAA